MAGEGIDACVKWKPGPRESENSNRHAELVSASMNTGPPVLDPLVEMDPEQVQGDDRVEENVDA
jgi:hypothetical protein